MNQPSQPMKRRTALRSIAAGALSIAAFTATGSIGCSSSWWQSITTNPGSAQQFVQYVTAFLQGVAAIWAIVFPFIPAAAQAQAQTDYNNAVFTVEQGVTALEDALNAAAAAQQPTPDFSKLIASIQAAVDALMKIVSAWQGTGGAAADGGTSPQATQRGAAATQMTELVRQQGVIHKWK